MNRVKLVVMEATIMEIESQSLLLIRILEILLLLSQVFPRVMCCFDQNLVLI